MARRGQATVESIGLALLVALLLGALGTAVAAGAPGLAGDLAAQLPGHRPVRRGDRWALLDDRYGPLVRRYAPTLVLERDRYGEDASVPVAFTTCRARRCAALGRGAPTAYVHVHRRGGDVYLHYWLYYPDSLTSHLPLAALRGAHADDWEGVIVRVRADGSAAARATAHAGLVGAAPWWAEASGWRPLTGAPVLYRAAGSHANGFARDDVDVAGDRWNGDLAAILPSALLLLPADEAASARRRFDPRRLPALAQGALARRGRGGHVDRWRARTRGRRGRRVGPHRGGRAMTSTEAYLHPRVEVHVRGTPPRAGTDLRTRALTLRMGGETQSEPGVLWATFKRLLGFLRPYRGAVWASVALALGAQACSLALPWLTGLTVDRAIRPRDTAELRLLVGLIVGAGLVRMVLMIGRRLVTGRMAVDVEQDLRNIFYAHLQRLSFRFYDTHQTGQLMSRGTVDLGAVRVFLAYGLLFFSQHAITIVTVAVMLLVTDVWLGLIALAITPLIAVVALRYSRVSHPVLVDAQQRVADVTTQAEETMVGVRVVKAFGQEPREVERFTARARDVFAANVKANRIRARYLPVLEFLPTLALGLVLLAGGQAVTSGRLTIGEFVRFTLLLALLVMPLRMIGMWVGSGQRSIASGVRLFEILDVAPEVADRADAVPLPEGRGAVRFEGVGFAYADGRAVLDGVDLAIAEGSTVAVIGPTGCGKTTLTSLIPRFYDATAGRVLVDGVDVRDLRLAELRRAVGIVSEDTFLFSSSIRDNIRFGRPDASDDDVRRAAERAQAAVFIDALPEGYDTLVGERGLTLSGGQRQRIAIARALLVDPRILILDDATASVDATTEARIKAALEEVMRGRTTIIIGHRLSTIALAERVVVLDHGRIVADGDHAELLATSPIYRSIHDHGLVDRTFVDLDGDQVLLPDEHRSVVAGERRSRLA